MPKTYAKKMKNIDLSKYTEVEIYQLVLNGTLKRFPNNFFDCGEVITYAPKITRYLLEDILKWTKEDIKEKLTKQTFYDNKLTGFIKYVYNNSPYKAIIHAYGEDYIYPWELKSTPMDYWQGEEGLRNAYRATKWLIEEKLKWNHEDIKEKLTKNIFIENGLTGMIRICFDYSPYKAIDYIYPDIFKPWEFKNVPKNYWNEENSILALKWLIEEKLKWNIDDIKNNLDVETFSNYGLSGMLQRSFSHSPFKAIDTVYPNKIKPWELKKVPLNYWTKETYKLAINSLVYEKLNWSKEYAKNNLTQKILIENDFSSITQMLSMKEIKDLID